MTTQTVRSGAIESGVPIRGRPARSRALPRTDMLSISSPNLLLSHALDPDFLREFTDYPLRVVHSATAPIPAARTPATMALALSNPLNSRRRAAVLSPA